MKRDAEKFEREQKAIGVAQTSLRLRAPNLQMWTQVNKPELVERDEALTFLLDHGCYKQVMEESLAWLKHQPYNLHAVESLLRAQWRSGDTRGALRSVNVALRLNPHEPGYYYMRGLLRQSVGMIREAMEDLQAARELTSSPEFLDNVNAAIRALEDWQIFILRILLAEDRLFKLELSIDSELAVCRRGFCLTSTGQKALIMLATDGAGLQIGNGIS